MQLTPGAIGALKLGANYAGYASLEINAITADGTKWDSACICAEKDGIKRGSLDYNEYKPNLQVKEVVWTEAIRKGVPMKYWIVTDTEDGENEMVMMHSTRNKEVCKNFLKKWGQSGKDCKLGKGKRFTLVDYYTTVTPANSHFEYDTPTIKVERIRMEPRSNHQQKLTSFLRVNRAN